MKLVFVYNANSGKLNTMFDIAHKIFRPETYECSLCLLTHDILTENSLLSAFKNNPNFDIEFLHKDEFNVKYDLEFEYPVILKNTVKIEVLLDHNDISKTKNMAQLIDKLERLNP